jgi:EGF-like domain
VYASDETQYKLSVQCTTHNSCSECSANASSNRTHCYLNVAHINNTNTNNIYNQRCICYSGYGDRALDVLDSGAVQTDCSRAVCPSGIPVFDASTALGSTLGYTAASATAAAAAAPHAPLECSGNGVCNTATSTCTCRAGFTGEACHRQSCPGEVGSGLTGGGICSGHGICLSLAELAEHPAAQPLAAVTVPPVTYGLERFSGTLSDVAAAAALAAKTWDAETFHACVCDSFWPVGLKNGEVQEAEFFGADCSLRRCPSGDNPETPVDETDCYNVSGAHNVYVFYVLI